MKIDKKIDHREISKSMDIYYIDDKVGKGLPIWLPNGLKLKNKILDYIKNKQEEYDFKFVETPILGNVSLYKKSGHFYHYKENMFPSIKVEDSNEEFMLRPMGCPHHISIYKKDIHSYKELPIKYSEFVKQFRYESSGSLLGLERVRMMELTDNHIFLKDDQIEKEVEKTYTMILEILEKFKIKLKYIELATSDFKNKKDKYFGDAKFWERAEEILERFLKKQKTPFKKIKGEAAFYGPKIDFQIETKLNHIITLSTIQLDFFLPQKFNVKYVNSLGKNEFVTMIHVGTIGTLERFISVLLEQTGGKLPFFVSPLQFAILPITNNKEHIAYSKKIKHELSSLNLDSIVDDSEERLSLKVRNWQIKKVNALIFVGDEETKSNLVSYRLLGENDKKTLSLDDFLEIIKKWK